MSEKQENIKKARAKKTHVFSRLIAKRYDYPIKFLGLKINRHSEYSEKLRQILLEEERACLDYEKEIQEVALARRKLKEDEYSRRRAVLEDKRAETLGRFKKIEEKIHSLRVMGITRTTMGFLTWAGYLGFLAFGWYLGQVLEAMTRNQGRLNDFLSVLVNSTYGLVGSMGRVWGSILLLSLPIVLWAILILVIFFSDFLMSQFDSEWRRDYFASREKPKKKPTRNPKKNKGETVAFGNWLGQIMGLASPYQGQFRSNYAELLARAPLYLIISEIPLLFAVLLALSGAHPSAMSDDTAASVIANPWKVVYFTFFGIVLLLILAGLAIVYTTRVIEPRFDRYLDKQKSTIHSISANIEIFLLLALTFSMLVLGEIARSFDLSIPNLWVTPNTGLILMLAILNSFVVAYGLVFKGVEKDREAMRRELDRYELDIQKYEELPITEIESDEIGRFRQELEKLQNDIDNKWKEADFWEEIEGFSGALRSPRFGFSVFGRSRDAPTSIDENLTYYAIDEMMEPDLVTEIGNILEELWELRNQVSLLKIQLESLKEKRVVLLGINWDAKMGELMTNIRDRQLQYHSSVNRIENEYAKRIALCDSAVRLGQFLRKESVNP